MYIGHSRLYSELQEAIECRAWVRMHKLTGVAAMIGLGLGIVLFIII